MVRIVVRMVIVVLLVGAALCAPAEAVPAADAGRHTLMRFPTLHGDDIVFEAHGNLWAVSRLGGQARRLTADHGYDMMPRFSPDGRWIAFTGQYQGNVDVYVMPAGGGSARRLTFHSDAVDRAPLRWGPDNMVVTWTPDSQKVVFLSRAQAWNTWYGRLFTVPLDGGLPTALPLDRGGLMTYSPDGGAIAYNRIFRNFRTWKRYDGGLSQKVYTYTFATRHLQPVTDWPGTSTSPMWYGRKIYFLSDHGAKRRANIWAYDQDRKSFEQVTHFSDYDIDFPSLDSGPQAGIVFQQAGSLWVLDLPSQQLHHLEVTVPDDGTRTGPRYLTVDKQIRVHDTGGDNDFMLSPNGKRAVFSARGDIFTVPAEHGATRNLTRTSNADEDHPSWSPDGRSIAYTTDVGGEQEIAIRPALGGAERIVTHFTHGFYYQPQWSPDGGHLAVSDANQGLWVVDVADGKATEVAHNAWSEIHDERWSPDGLWLAYSLIGTNQQRGIWLYSLQSGHATRVSDPMNNDYAPVFSPNGKYLFYVSTRHENATFSESEENEATLKSTAILVATLQRDEPSPFAPQSDEGAVEPDNAEHGEHKASYKPEASKPIRIDLDGLMGRSVPVPAIAEGIAALDVRDDKVFYQTAPPWTLDGPLSGETAALHVFDMQKRKDAVVLETDTYSLSADGTKVMYQKDGSFYIADVVADQDKTEPAKLDLSAMRAAVEPTQEWAEMFYNAWRLERDLFVNARMNGVDWPAVRQAYARLLTLLGSRQDLNYLIGQVQGELSNSHTYVGDGDDQDPDAVVPTALLGVDFSLDKKSGRYVLATIYPGDNTRPGYRSPLTEPGVDVRAGDYLLAVDGRELQAPTDPYSLFVGLGDQPVTLTVADSPTGRRRDVTVTPLKSELKVREQAWIEANRKTVDRLSGGKIAYLYLSDMEALGMQQFIRQFYPQLDKHALIVDDRFNGGGFIDQIVLERLRRILVGMGTNRAGAPMTVPQQLIDGPKVCLINEYSASDGDIFPYFFRQYGLGPLIGMRTWGGVRGIRGDWGLLDGGYITIPEGTMYGLDSHWVIENHGVDPDMVVQTTPGELLDGHDQQLEAAVHYLLGELQKHPRGLPPPPPWLPAYPPPGH